MIANAKSQVDHKESFRLLTGQRLSQLGRYIPKEVSASVNELSRTLDDVTLDLISKLAHPLFNMKQNEVCDF